MKTIVVVTGSFNPVTTAHYKILSDAVAKYNADEGVFVTTNDAYLAKKCLLKTKEPTNFILSEAQRGAMLNALAAENPKLSWWGSEVGGIDPRTYDTLLRLYRDKKKRYAGEEIKLYFLFGADKLKNVPHWRNADELIGLCEYLVYARHFDLEGIISSDTFLKNHRDRIHLMTVEDEDLEDVSSSEVRRRFFAGEDYSALMEEGPLAVLKTLFPSDFPPVCRADIIKGQILYGGRFGKNAARLEVFRDNRDIFAAWNMPALGQREAHRQAVAYAEAFRVAVPARPQHTFTDCVNADCVDVAEGLIADGLKPAILNLASRFSPCGGYNKGLNAQEESLAHMSTLSQSLYQFGNPKYKHIRESGTTYVAGVYPLEVNYGGVYSPCVTFFRYNEDKYYALRENPFDCAVVSVASLANREKNGYTDDERAYFTAEGCLNEPGREVERNKIRTILRIALSNGHDSIVLGAFGCGVFNLHCDEVAALFRDVLDEAEFKDTFAKVVFAIYEGKPTPRRPDKGKDGKFKPFYDLFARRC